jgi:tetratricopeptide (TPR) repeat protein
VVRVAAVVVANCLAEHDSSPSVDTALELLRAGRTADAEGSLRLLLTRDPQHAEGAYHLARLLIDSGRIGEAAGVLSTAIERRPDRASEFGIAVFALARSGAAEALPLLQRVAAQAPGDIVVQCRLGELLDEGGDAAAAACQFALAAEIEPASDDTWQWLYKAIALVRTHRVEAAEAILLRVLERDPRHVETTCQLATLLIAQDRLEEALARLTALIEPGSDDAASQRRSECTYLVFQLVERGMTAAVPLLRTIVEHAPSDVVAAHRMGEALESIGEPTAAAAYFERAALIVPSGSDPWQQLYHAIALVRAGRVVEAETALRALLRTDEPLIEAAYHLCRLLVGQQRLPEAAAVLAAEVESCLRGRRDGERVNELAPLAAELAELGVPEAVPVLERLVERTPDDALLRRRLATALPGHARALMRLGRIDAAESALRQLLVLHPGHEDAVHRLAQLSLDRGRPLEALSLLAAFVGGLSTDGPAPERIAQFNDQLYGLAHAGLEEAVPLLGRLADLVPGDPAVQFRLAEASETFGDAHEATRYFTRAADATPPPADIWGRLFTARALQRLGRDDDAETALRALLRADEPLIEAAYHLCRLLVGQQRLPEAAAVLAAEVESCLRGRRGGERVNELAPLAAELTELGVPEAVPVLERFVERTPDDVRLRHRLATALARHAPAEAMLQFQRIAAAEPTGSDAEPRLYHALALVRLGRMDAAESALRQLLVLHPGHEDAVLQLSQLHIDHGRPSESLSLLASFVDGLGADGRTPERIAQFSDQLDSLAHARFKDVVPLLRRLADWAPDDPAVQFRLAEASARFGDAHEATRHFTRAADATPGPTDVWGWLFKAMALQRLGQDDEAEASLRALLLADDHLIEVAYHLCRLLVGQHRLPEAAAVLAAEVDSCLRGRRGGERVIELAQLAAELAELGVREVVPVLERLVERTPDDTRLRHRLATALARHAPSDARPHFQRIAAAEPTGPDVEPRLYHALALVRLGRKDAAEVALRQLLVLHPGHEEAVQQLSELYIDRGRPVEALSLLAALVDRLSAEGRAPERIAHFSAQLELLAHAGFADVVPLLHRLADLAPGDLSLQFRLADASAKFGDAHEATRHFTRAADATPGPTDVWGWLFKAMALQRLGRGDEAEAALRYALSLDAPPVEVTHQMVQRLIATERFAEAIDMLDAVVAAAPPRNAILMPLAAELVLCGIASADVVLQRIVESNASDERALILFAQFAHAFSLTREATACIDRARAISDTAAHRIDSRLLVPFVLSSDEDIPVLADRFARGVDALIGSGIEVENPLSCLASPPYFQFFTFGTDTRDLNRKAAHLWQSAYPALRWTAPHCLSWRRRPLNRRLRIGFFTQPTFPLVWGIARALDRDAFEVVHLHESTSPMTPGAPWQGAADRHVVVPGTSISDAQRVVAEQELDILVHMPFTNLRYFLSHARLAPLQCVLCEPCYTDALENLDYYISWRPAEPAPLDDWYCCAVALMESAPYWLQRDYTRPSSLCRADFPLPQEARWYVCPAAGPKLHPRFDPILARILAADPDGVLVFLRGEAPMGRFAMQRIRRAIGPAADRVYALPTLPADKAHAVIGLADSVLDAWPIGGMSSAFAAIHAGIPTVTMPEHIPFGRWLASMYEAIGVTDLIASTPDEYVDRALRLASDPAWRAGLAERIRARRDIFVENQDAVREIETFLCAAASATHRGDAPRHWKRGRFTG